MTLVLDDVDATELQQIKALAHSNRLTLEEQATRLIREALQGRDRRQLRAAFEASAALSPKDVEQTDSVELIRADRDR